MICIWHNGKFLEDGAPIFTLADRIRLGDGVYDTLLAVNGKALHAPRHRQRLLDGCAVLGIAADLGTWEDDVRALLARNGQTQERFAVNTIISRGPAPRGLEIPGNPDIQIALRASAVADAYPPVRAVIANNVRRNEGSPLARIKSLQCGESILALTEAADKGANEGILLNNAGAVACASASNVFAVIEGRLVTPPLRDGAMAGVMRALLMEHVSAQERTLWPQDLLRAEALYLTNSVRGVTPVTSLNGKSYGPPTLPIDKDFGVS